MQLIVDVAYYCKRYLGILQRYRRSILLCGNERCSAQDVNACYIVIVFSFLKGLYFKAALADIFKGFEIRHGFAEIVPLYLFTAYAP